MTEVALDDERVSSFSYKQRRGRVPKIMHPDPRKAGCAQRRKPDAGFGSCYSSIGPPPLDAVKTRASGVGVRVIRQMLRQGVGDEGRKIDCACTVVLRRHPMELARYL